MKIDFYNELNPKQFDACTSDAQYLRVVAGAGTGKTRVLTYRIAYLITERLIVPHRIVAITFTNKVAKEMQDRVQAILDKYQIDVGGKRPLISTFHGFCYRFLRRESKYMDGFTSNFVIADDDAQDDVFKSVFDELQIAKDKAVRKYIKDVIGNLKSKAIFSDDVQESDVPMFGLAQPKVVIACYKVYQRILKQRNSLDFDDLLMFTFKILVENYEIRDMWCRKYDAYLVDEFQDTNKLQYQILTLLMGDQTMLTVVGDPDQNIYTWRGADCELFQKTLPFDFPSLKTITLDLNYRSTQKILDRANNLIANNKKRIPKNLQAFKSKNDEEVTFHPFDSPESEAAYVRNEILGLKMSGAEYKDIAIIYRSNFVSSAFESELAKNKIPYNIIGGQKFYDRAEIKDALSYMRLLVNPLDDFSFARAITAPRIGMGDVTIKELKKIAVQNNKTVFQLCMEDFDILPLKGKTRTNLEVFKDAYWNALGELNTDEPDEIRDAVYKFLTDTRFIDYVNKKDLEEDKTNLDSNDTNGRIKNIHELMSQLYTFLTSDNFDEDGNIIPPTLDEFLISIAIQYAEDEVENSNKVTLMTAHASKGLEFPYVFVVSLNEDILPSAHAQEKGLDGIEEERRLCYVACTRAKEKLFLSSRGGYDFVAQCNYTTSRFVYEMGFPRTNTNLFSYGGSTKGKSAPSSSKGWTPVISKKPAPLTPTVHTSLSFRPIEDAYMIGDKIQHDSFGTGEVIEVGKTDIAVKFENGIGVKKLSKGFKKMRKIS